MSTTISRRAFTAGSIATIVGGATFISLPTTRAVVAQGTTDLASLGLPTLDITVMAADFEGMPEQIEAGRYLVTLTLAENVEYSGAGFLQPSAGMTAEEFVAERGPSGAASEASPPAVDASPEAEEGLMPEVLPTFIYQTHFAGGIETSTGQANEAVIDLGPGEWILWNEDPESPQAPVIFTATGEMPADLPEPDADIDATLIDFGITIAGALTAGEHVLRIENRGAQPHYLELLKGPNQMTNEQITQLLAAFAAGSDATPPDVDWDPETDLISVFLSATQSIGTVMWSTARLDAGTYAAFCFFPTAGEGLPHAIHGMHTVFQVT